MIPRLRFAPSPTGTPHIGNLHTALFSWALARALRGDFILRIEDTDPERNTPAAQQQMLDALNWLGIDWDEGPDVGGDYGPYIQSQRIIAHRRVIERLLDEGHAYYGDDPAHPATAVGNPLRLRFPATGQTTLNDAIRGPIVFDNAAFSDPVLVRSDGRPLYHLAAMTDDHDMAITHVVRGEEWIASSPIHVRLYQVLGWQEPVWVHVPLILNRHGQKLSKRDPEGGYLISDFQDAGYLPEAVFNYLLLLGWSPDGEQEIVSKWDVRRQFRIERLSPTAPVFDWDKLNWVNRQYMARLSDAALAERLRPYLDDAYGPLPGSPAFLEQLTAVVRSELNTAEDVIAAAEWAFVDDIVPDAGGRAALRSAPAVEVLVRLVAEVAAVVLLDATTTRHILDGLRRTFKAAHGWSAGQVLHPIRAALTGTTEGPPLHEIMGIIGKQRTLLRTAAALRAIESK